MTNDDGTGRLRFKHDDLVEWDVMVITPHDGKISEGQQQGRITSLGARTAVIATPQGPLKMPLKHIRPALG